MRGPNRVERAVQGTNLKKFGELLTQKFDRVKTLRNNSQQHVTTCNRVCKRTCASASGVFFC